MVMARDITTLPIRRKRRAFTLIELLVVVAIIALLVSILLPALSGVRKKGRATKCMANLHVLGHGISIYATEYNDALLPSRLPKLDDCNAYAMLYGVRKFRPTFLAMLSVAVSMPPFADPKACKTDTDRYGEPGDRQNYASPVYVCPSVAEWTDERNASYGWNYQFLGNSRLIDDDNPTSYKNWVVRLAQIRHPGRTVAVADSMGTAAAFPPMERGEYANNERDEHNYGDEGFNLDPPRVDPVNGEIAGHKTHSRSAVDPRHVDKANVLWLDSHVSGLTLAQLGYKLEPDGVISDATEVEVDDEASNSKWTGNGLDLPWTPAWTR